MPKFKNSTQLIQHFLQIESLHDLSIDDLQSEAITFHFGFNQLISLLFTPPIRARVYSPSDEKNKSRESQKTTESILAHYIKLRDKLKEELAETYVRWSKNGAHFPEILKRCIEFEDCGEMMRRGTFSLSDDILISISQQKFQPPEVSVFASYHPSLKILMDPDPFSQTLVKYISSFKKVPTVRVYSTTELIDEKGKKWKLFPHYLIRTPSKDLSIIESNCKVPLSFEDWEGIQKLFINFVRNSWPYIYKI